MRRPATSTALLALAAAVLVPAPSATGAPPSPVDTTQTFDAGDACSFPIRVDAEGEGKTIDLPGNPIFFQIQPAPQLRITVTNLDDTSKTATVNATGAFRFVALPDGGILIRASGHNFVYGVPEAGATALATTGPIEITVDANGEIAELDLTGARVRDLCTELA
jgi:hypothetical protein